MNPNEKRLAKAEKRKAANEDAAYRRKLANDEKAYQYRDRMQESERESKYSNSRGQVWNDVKETLVHYGFKVNDPVTGWLYLGAFRRAKGSLATRVSQAAMELDEKRTKYQEQHPGDPWPPSTRVRPGDPWEELRKLIHGKDEFA